ncbi:hypothetical protein DPM33_12850 [Mesorhizobium hawassense]|uniref:Uncharacterized protein n=1 Tax=Mesorhizobium hawassense TaxID=1209954 RepID=A0A330HUY9_9HYPH|nr:hypothetical protein [Mesorhizobium hawassense]RAZ90409.1 hypothetical protein DPM33_12850 [Mesorhizobium hawassense]
MFDEIGTPPELQDVIDDCYEAFASYRPPRWLDAPPYRDPAAILATLSSAPLRQLTSDQLGPYASWAMTTVGGEDDYKHFLPRILELAIGDQSHPGIDPPAIAGKLRYGGWPTWSVEERAAVQAVFAGAWRYALKQHPDDYDPERWLNGIALIDSDLDAALAAWLSSPSPNATLQLAEFFRGTAERLFSDRANRDFWQGAGDEAIETMRRWLPSEPVVDRLLSAGGTVGSGDEWRIDQALLALNALSPARPR